LKALEWLLGAGLVAFAASAATAASGPSVVAPGIAVAQGGVYRGQLPPGAAGLMLDGIAVHSAADGRYMIGFGRDAGPASTLVFRTGDGTPVLIPVAVAPRPWRIQSLPNLPQRPVPDAEFEARRPAEVAKIAAVRAGTSDGTAWASGFVAPASGPVTGIYGSQRILAGTPSAPHAGLDFAAAIGDPVVAPAAGIVRLAEGPFTLEGNLVMIDHGMGLVSALLHLSRIDVLPGEVVAQGQLVGAVGQTGRATGPHLHWGMKWRDERIDPQPLAGPM